MPLFAKLIFGLVWAAGLLFTENRAVVIGVGAYTGDALGTTPLKYADRDATLFFDRYVKPKGSGFDSKSVLLTKDADYSTVSYRIERAIRAAGEKDTVYLYFSARGIAWPGDKIGYIVTLSGSSSKPQSTAYSLADLNDLLRSPQIRAERIIILADVNRKPPAAQGNHIQVRLSELGSQRVGGVLATKRGVSSDVNDKVQYGFFTESLVNALIQKPPSRSAKTLKGDVDFTQLKNYLHEDTRVEPETFGSLAGSIVHTHSASIAIRRPPVLLAALRFLPGLLALTPAAAGPCFEPKDVDNPGSLVAEVMEQRLRLSNEEWTECREKAGLALASEGQKYVTRYGTTDLLPGDPLKVDRNQFRHASDAFRAALQLFAGLGAGAQFESNLNQRYLFCKGMAENSEKLLVDARSRGTRPLPDIENAIGAMALESTNGPDFTRALLQFREAKSLSPSWMYPRHNIALVLIEQGNVREAEAEYRQAIRLTPWQPYLHYNLALLLQRDNRRKEAKRTYNRAIATYDKAIGTLTGRVSDWASDYPEDVRLAERRIKVFHANKAIVLNAMGALAESSGKDKDAKLALKLYGEAWNMDSALCAARYNEAMLRQKRAEKKVGNSGVVSPETVGLHSDNVRVCPTFLPSILESGRLALKSGGRTTLESARDLLESERGKPPEGNTQKLHVLGQIHSALGEHRPAVKVLELAVEMQQGSSANGHASPALYKDLALAYEKLGDERACPTWLKASEGLTGASSAMDRNKIQAKLSPCARKDSRSRP